MKLDLDTLKKKIQDEANEAKEQSERSNGGFPIVYPGENGKLVVRLLYNVKSGSVQRRVVRHPAGKGKVACLQPYGEDCPVCQAIHNVENMKGRECGAFSKYGFKTRGICYAMIIDHDPVYFTSPDDPKKGDVVLLMYPKTVYDQINTLLINSGDNLDKVLSENEGFPVIIERSQKKGGYPTYNTAIDPFGLKKVYEDNDEGTGEERFDSMLESIPDLNSTLIPNYPDDNLYKSAEALAQTITQEYMSSSIVNPSTDDTIEDDTNEVEESATTPVDVANIPDSSASSSDVPECFGNHCDDKKCLICPIEADCFMKTGK